MPKRSHVAHRRRPAPPSPHLGGWQHLTVPGRSLEPPVTKRRSSQACLSCRNRKVRCDVINGGMPCTNCRLDDVHCVVKETRRGRRPSAVLNARENASQAGAVVDGREPEQQQQQHDSQEVQPHPSTLEEEDEQEEDEQMEDAYAQAQRLNSPPLSASSVASERFDSSHYHQQHQHSQGQPSMLQESQSHNHRPRLPLSGHDGTHRGFVRAPLSSSRTPQLPCYIKAVPQHLDDGDVDYMARKHCFDVPDDEFRDELLRVYISIVYPLLPAIDLEDFVESITENDGRKPISLLLFQSIIFLSIAFIDAEFLFSRGYSSRKAARKDYFERVRILYGLNYERDRVALIQSLLAMTYWYDAPDDDKDTWYWMGIVLTTAQVAGFHRDPSAATVPNQVKDARLRRRIWWCCIMRDSLLALGLRRPSRIRDDEYTVSSLTQEDFDLGPPSARLVALFQNSTFPCPDMNSRADLAFAGIELCKLCLTINRILRTQYTVIGAYYGGSEYLLDGSNPLRRTEHQVSSLAQCSQELKEWVQRQDARALYTPGAEPPPEPLPPGGTSTRKINTTRFHQIQLHMLYLAARNALNKPQVFCRGPDLDETGQRGQRQPRELVSDAVVDMTKLAFDLQRYDQLRYLTTTAVPAFLAVCLAHLLNIRQLDETSRNLSLGRLYQSVHVLQQLQSVYSAADYAICFLKSILKKSQLRVPLLSMEENTIYRRHDGWVAKSAIDMGPSHVAAACMYPSPSASAHLTKNMDEHHPRPSPNVAVDMWNPQGQGDLVLMGETLPFHELITDSPYWSSWYDFDDMIPALMNESGNNASFTGGVPLCSFGPTGENTREE